MQKYNNHEIYAAPYPHRQFLSIISRNPSYINTGNFNINSIFSKPWFPAAFFLITIFTNQCQNKVYRLYQKCFVTKLFNFPRKNYAAWFYLRSTSSMSSNVSGFITFRWILSPLTKNNISAYWVENFSTDELQINCSCP